MPGRALVVHASNLLVKGSQTIDANRHAPGGGPVNALFGLTRALTRAVEHKAPDMALAIVEDDPPLDVWGEALAGQHREVERLVGIHGFVAIKASDAIHLVASYVRAATEAGHDVVVVGSDKRLAQLVGDSVWWYEPYKDVRYTPDMIRKRFEVGPESVSGWLALVGDDDSLPGVKGLGKKGATSLIETYGSIGEALARQDEVEGRAGKALRAGAADVERELARAKLDATRELPRPLDELIYRAPEHEETSELYAELGFLELLTADAGPGLELFVCADAEAVAKALSEARGELLSLHVVTGDPSPVRGELTGLAFTQGDERSVYVPLAGKEAVPEGAEVLRSFLEDDSLAKVGHDIKAVSVAFARQGIHLAGVVGDSGCASHLHQPSNWAPQDLSLLSRQVLRRALPEEDEVRGVGRSRRAWSKLPAEKTGRFAAQQADAAIKVWRKLEPTTDKSLLQEYLELSKTLVRMELRGICVDADDLVASGADFERINEELESQIYELAGTSFNLGSTKQLGSVLFEDLGLPVLRRTKTGWSTATDALERIEHAHPIVGLVIRWRRLRRLQDTWVTALLACIDDDGRVRSTFSPARSFTGRLVNANPDLGRVPGRTPEMQRIRHAFTVPEGYTMLSLDYRQLGLYVLAHLTGDPALVEPLTEGEDMHRLTAAAVLDKAPGAVSVDDRQLGKVVNFATFAGQGASALALQLGITAKEAKDYIARFDMRYAVARAFQDEQLRLAQERGYIETIAGRHWPIGDLSNPDQMIRGYAERLARRATHEGSVADVSRRGLLHADLALRQAGIDACPLLQIHDEILFEVRTEEVDAAASVASEAMRSAYDLRVPLRVGRKTGPNWADLK